MGAYLELESMENKYARKRNLKERSERFNEENVKLEEQMALTDEFRQMGDFEKFCDQIEDFERDGIDNYKGKFGECYVNQGYKKKYTKSGRTSRKANINMDRVMKAC